MDRRKLPKIEKMPADMRALGVLREQIITGSIPAGSRLTEIEISEEMALSRATVRTALHQLAKEGLVSLVPYTGWTVVKLSRQDMWELFTLRSAVERLAAMLAARNGTDHGRLVAAFSALEKACNGGSPEDIAEADFAFHKAIIAMAGHGRLTAQYALIEQQIRVFIRSSNVLIADPRDIISQHLPIYAAITGQDEVLASELCERHSLQEGEKLISTM